MRVVAGRARGRRLVGPDTRTTRPLTDRAKEGLFSALGPVEGMFVLDLYAGSGSIGIEALSRGATRAVFVESGRKALAALQRNLEELQMVDSSAVVSRPVESFLTGASDRFDLIFFDPPWELDNSTVEAQLLVATKLVSDDGEMVVHRRRSDVTLKAPEDWVEGWRRDYGDSRLYRFVRSDTAEWDLETEPI